MASGLARAERRGREGPLTDNPTDTRRGGQPSDGADKASTRGSSAPRADNAPRGDRASRPDSASRADSASASRADNASRGEAARSNGSRGGSAQVRIVIPDEQS